MLNDCNYTMKNTKHKLGTTQINMKCKNNLYNVTQVVIEMMEEKKQDSLFDKLITVYPVLVMAQTTRTV